jgi:hypothetical protein
MQRILKYVSPLCILAAAIIGVAGDTFDAHRHGLAKITGLGWAAMLVALFFFAVTAIGIHRTQETVNRQSQQAALVRGVAHRQILMAVRRLLHPFYVALYKFSEPPTRLDVDLDRLDEELVYFVERLSSPDVRAAFHTIDLRGVPNVFPSCLWWELLSQSAAAADESLDEATTKYSTYIEPETLVEVEDLRSDDFVRRLTHLDDLVLANKHMAALPLEFLVSGVGGYQEFDAMLGRLRELSSTIEA